MNIDPVFKINGPNVVFEIIEGEVVIVNLLKGHYYSLVEAGADIWQGITKGFSREGIVEDLVARYDANREDIRKGIKNLVKKMEEEGLIAIENNPPLGNVAKPDAQDKVIKDTEKLKFKAPVLQKYTDMEQILLLDPVHDVDNAGWPNKDKEKK